MKCWNCGHKTMFPWESLGKGWFKCSDCGATWIKPLKPFRALVRETVIYPDGRKEHPYKAKLTGRKVKR